MIALHLVSRECEEKKKILVEIIFSHWFHYEKHKILSIIVKIIEKNRHFQIIFKYKKILNN